MPTLSNHIKKMAYELGFMYCGISASKRLEEDERHLEAWLNKGYHGMMSYMANHFDMRVDPGKLVPGAKSVITVLMNYFPVEKQPEGLPKISKYAYGNDYHELIREKLNQLLFRIRELAGDVQGRGFVDSAPVLERAWARESGLGWMGKNGNLINKTSGSFFFIATLITDLELDYDAPFARDYCGTCTRCIDACPTGAILPDGTVAGDKCISYFTIELKSQLIPEEQQGKFDNWMFGCDTCQDVCPWNRFSQPATEPGFSAIPGLFSMAAEDWEQLGEDAFRKMFRHSPLKRAKYAGVLRNLHFIAPRD
ncbi:tRNA epoxyqueuosine(34) reductase QueG [Flavihumibacter petaseus]|uniref:Epoxyqueuosine reductase n=1 Tax=Flavihumibacter petaseus NBRC 106054 TaxID=1220578 RepID=A0A0E9N1Y6_9BACT|nr:tRNA epoxyqueuosine(34) reductase QueG [Flavihumibacter petaseus]GAO43646.1 epoxyqueuosine reductase [Flavihumibacter petaseus NBRC 106054]